MAKKTTKSKSTDNTEAKVRFPKNLLVPVADFLSKQLKTLERRKKDIEVSRNA